MKGFFRLPSGIDIASSVLLALLLATAVADGILSSNMFESFIHGHTYRVDAPLQKTAFRTAAACFPLLLCFTLLLVRQRTTLGFLGCVFLVVTFFFLSLPNPF